MQISVACSPWSDRTHLSWPWLLHWRSLRIAAASLVPPRSAICHEGEGNSWLFYRPFWIHEGATPDWLFRRRSGAADSLCTPKHSSAGWLATAWCLSRIRSCGSCCHTKAAWLGEPFLARALFSASLHTSYLLWSLCERTIQERSQLWAELV